MTGRRAIQNWWNRVCGARDVLAISLPLVVSMLSFTVMQFCDRLFLTWHSSLDLAAVVPAGALAWTTVSLPMGLAMFATTFVAQYQGAGLSYQIGRITWQAVWIGIACVPLFIALGFCGRWLFEASGHAEHLVSRESDYFLAVSFSSGAVVINSALSAFFIGLGRTGKVMVINLLAAACNVVLDYWMIFGVEVGGNVWWPAGGIAGAGWATTLAIWSKTGMLTLLFLRPANRSRYYTATTWRWDPVKMKRLFQFGLPNGFQFFIEGFAITVFILIVARLSDTASAATALAFSINMIVFVPIIGLGQGVTTLVGQQLGRGQPDLASRATWTAFVLGMVYTSFFAVTYLAVPNWYLAAHQNGAENFAEIHDLAVKMLVFVAVFCLFDTIQITFVSAIKGAGDTLFVVLVTIATSVLFLIAGAFGSQFWERSDPQRVTWWWYCLTGWIVLLSVAYFGRFYQGRWRTMSVIEPDLVATDLGTKQAGSISQTGAIAGRNLGEPDRSAHNGDVPHLKS